MAAAQKKEQENSQQLQQELEETRQTCEAFKGEVTSLLTDLQEQGEMIRKVEAEKDVHRNQVYRALPSPERHNNTMVKLKLQS